MMTDVYSCEYLEFYKEYYKDNWIDFCKFFNENVRIYGKVDENLHYFRLKLNIAPATLEKMYDEFADDPNLWTLCTIWQTRFHMIGKDGEYNIKFVSSDSLGNMFEAVYNKEGILLTEINCPENMGTYNYCGTYYDNKLHHAFDVNTYEQWGNTKETPYIEGSEYEKFISQDSRELTNQDATDHYNDIVNKIRGYMNEK